MWRPDATLHPRPHSSPAESELRADAAPTRIILICCPSHPATAGATTMAPRAPLAVLALAPRARRPATAPTVLAASCSCSRPYQGPCRWCGAWLHWYRGDPAELAGSLVYMASPTHRGTERRPQLSVVKDQYTARKGSWAIRGRARPRTRDGRAGRPRPLRPCYRLQPIAQSQPVRQTQGPLPRPLLFPAAMFCTASAPLAPQPPRSICRQLLARWPDGERRR